MSTKKSIFIFYKPLRPKPRKAPKGQPKGATEGATKKPHTINRDETK